MITPSSGRLLLVVGSLVSSCADEVPTAKTDPEPLRDGPPPSKRDPLPGPAKKEAPPSRSKCTPSEPVRDHRDEPPTAALFGEVGTGPPELARLRGLLPVADARCISAAAVEMNERELFLASGVLYDLVVAGDTITGTGLSLQAVGVDALVAAWGPAQQHDCWFASDRHRRACLAPGVGDYPWRRLAFEDVTPLAELLGDAPGRLADLPVLVGAPIDDLLHLRVRADVASQPPGAPPPGRFGRLHLAPMEWGYGETTVALTLQDDAELTVVGASFSVPYVDAASKQALLDVLVAHWTKGVAPPQDEPGLHVFQASTPRVVVRDRSMFDGGGSWDVDIER